MCVVESDCLKHVNVCTQMLISNFVREKSPTPQGKTIYWNIFTREVMFYIDAYRIILIYPNVFDLP